MPEEFIAKDTVTLTPETASQEVTPRFLTDSRVLGKPQDTLLSDEKPTEPAKPQEPATEKVEPEPVVTPDKPDVAPVNEPEGEGTEEPPEPKEDVKPDDFSTNLPGLTVQDKPEDSAVIPQVQSDDYNEFKPGDDAPTWQHTAFANIVNDQGLSDSDKKSVLQQNPYAWDKFRQREKSGKIIGRFSDRNVPINEVFSDLETYNGDRLIELEVEAVSRIITDESKIQAFGESKPEVLRDLLNALVELNPDLVTRALNARGYNVVEDKPFDVEAALEEMRNNPLWEGISDSELEEQIISQMKSLAEKVQPNIQPDGTEDADPSPETPANTEYLQQAASAVQNARDSVWVKAISEGVSQSGIKPATQSEVSATPLAHIKTFLHHIAVHGLPGVIPDWESQSLQYAAGDEEFNKNRALLREGLESGKLDEFNSRVNTLAPTYYTFGQQRGKMGIISNLWKQVDAMVQSALSAKPAPEPEPAPAPQQQPQQQYRRPEPPKVQKPVFISDARSLAGTNIQPKN